MSSLITIFLSIFLAELGDKTQIATVLFAADGQHSPLLVFVAAFSALALSTVLAVLLGTLAEQWLSFLPLKLIAGIGFVFIGLWMIFAHLTASA